MTWLLLLGLLVADLTDAQVGDTLDYLGQSQPTQSHRLTTLPSASAAGGGAVVPPITPQAAAGPEPSSPSGNAATAPSDSTISQLLSGGRTALKLAERIFQQPSQQSTRGNSPTLSDTLRSAGADTGAGAAAGAAGDLLAGSPGAPPMFLELTTIDPLTGQLISTGTEGAGLSGFGGAATAPAIEGAAASGAEAGGEAAGEAAAGAGAGSVVGAISAIPSVWEAVNDYFKAKSRAESIAQSRAAGIRDVSTVLPQLSAGAVDPQTIASMSPAELRQLYTDAINAYGASSQLASPFSFSQQSKMGIPFPDYTQAINAARVLEPVDFVNMVAAYDALAKQNMTPEQSLAFPEALHALSAYAGLPTYGPQNQTALSPFDPYYKNLPVVQGMPSENDPVGTRQATTPEEYLSTIGADPALAAKLAPLMEGVQPGGYLDRARQIFTLLNPAFDQSQLGALFARLGNAAPSTPSPAPATPAPSATAPSPAPVMPSGPSGALGFASDVLSS